MARQEHGRARDDDEPGIDEARIDDRKLDKKAKQAGVSDGVPIEVAQAAACLGGALLLSLALTAAPLMGAVRGEGDLLDAVLWWAACFVVTRIALGLLFQLWATYRRSIDDQRRREYEERLRREAEAATLDVASGSFTVPGIARMSQ